MAASDARPIPRKNIAFRVTFPLLDETGALVTGAASLDSEVSLDGGTFADCTNEATEIATASGMYFLDLTSAELNADTVAIIVKSADAKTTPIVLYPEELGDLRVEKTGYELADGAITAAKFAAGALDAVWSVATRTLTAFGFGVTADTVSDKTGYSLAVAPPTAVEVRTEMDSNSTKLDVAVGTRASQTSVDDVPTNAELTSALADLPTNSELTTALGDLNDITVADLLTTAMTESYAAQGAAPTLTQAVLEILQFLTEKDVAGTTVTTKRRNGSTTAATYTLDDDTAPTAISRA